MTFDYSQTYLYKLHKLTNALDRTFDQSLRRHASISMSQLTLLLSIRQHQPVGQRAVATFLDLSPGAISRQVSLALESGWITVKNDSRDRRGQTLQLTPLGHRTIEKGMAVLEDRLFSIFDHSNSSTHLMGHIDLLLGNIKSLNGSVRPRSYSDGSLPKAADIFRKNGGDINRAVIDVQTAVGHHVSEAWWIKNIGITENDLATAERFDDAYSHYIQQIADIDK